MLVVLNLLIIYNLLVNWSVWFKLGVYVLIFNENTYKEIFELV